MDTQLGLFGDDRPVVRKPPKIVIPIVTNKPTVLGRAGSVLTPGAKIAIMGPGKDGKRKSHGVIDQAKMIAQLGGEKGNFIYRKLSLVTLALPVWGQIKLRCETIEIVDHTMNQCYTIPTWVCRQFPGTVYNAGIGDRIGWPMHWWHIVDANGEIVQRGKAPGE